MKSDVRESIFRIAKLIVLYLVYQFAFTVLAMVGVVVYGIVSGTLDVSNIAALQSSGEVLPMSLTVWAMAIGLFLSSLCMLWHLLHFKYFSFGSAPFKQIESRVMILSIALVFVCMWVFNVCAGWMDLPDNLARQMEALSNNVLGVFTISILAPLLEEVLFRGAIQGYLMQRFSPWTSIIISSLIFGVIHMNPIQVFYATCVGIVFGWIYYRTRSLVPVVVGHVLNNSLAALTMILGIGDEELDIARGGEIMIVLAGTFIAVSLAVSINKQIPAVPSPWRAAGE